MNSTGDRVLLQQSEGEVGRSSVKCDCCRQRHKKCFPASRKWPGTRCTPCDEAHLPCGPSVHWKYSSWSSPDKPATKRVRTQSSPAPQTQSQSGSGLQPPISPERSHQLRTPDKQPQINSSSPPNSFSSPIATPSGSSASSTKLNFEDVKDGLHNPIGKNIPGSLIQEGLVSRLIDLGFLYILYEYWKGLEASSNPPLHTETGTAINSNLKHLAWCTAHAAQCTLKIIISLNEVESRSTESQALRYREALDTIEDFNKLGSRGDVLVELEVTILSKLILIYEQQNDEPTVRRFSLRRSKLQSGSSKISDPCHIEHAAQCWLRTTGKLPSLVKSLDLEVEAPLRTNATPLFPAQHSAVRCGHDDIANVLCKLDGAFQNQDMLQQDPILAAAAVGKLSLFDTRVHGDKSLLKSRDLFQRTLLFHTSGRGNLETFVTLVQAGANVFDRDEAGQTILGAACAAGNLDVVRWLFEVGGVENPNDHYFGPRSPLHDAARSGHKSVCSLLLEKGAYVDYLVDNVTPAQVARANGFNDLAEMLESCLANPTNQYPSNSSFDAPQHPMQADGVPSLDVYRVNKYGCPSPLPSRVSYADVAAGKKRDPTEYRDSLLASSPTESEVEFDRLPLDDSIDVVDSGRLFGD